MMDLGLGGLGLGGLGLGGLGPGGLGPGGLGPGGLGPGGLGPGGLGPGIWNMAATSGGLEQGTNGSDRAVGRVEVRASGRAGKPG
jgi:hypothetical protein